MVALRCSYYAFVVSDDFAVEQLDFPVIITYSKSIRITKTEPIWYVCVTAYHFILDEGYTSFISKIN